MRILIVTDAWEPQVNGVVRTLKTVTAEMQRLGHTVECITPDQFRTWPCPGYSEIRLALFPGRTIARTIDRFEPHAIHIATEGPLGFAARRHCLRRQLPFTTSFHTRFPEYVHARWRVPLGWSYALLRRFHAPAETMMVATPSLQAEMRERGFARTRLWSRGVDTELFRPRTDVPAPFADKPRPIWTYVGRVAVEKSIDDFLKLDLPGTKVVIGDGPQRAALERDFPEATFLGARFGEELAALFAGSDCFVFPSRTDTFGLVLLEALASGAPVAAFPVQGPLDVIGDAPVGVLSKNLKEACERALSIPREDCRVHALGFSWEACARQFIANLALDIEAPEEPAEGGDADRPALAVGFSAAD